MLTLSPFLRRSLGHPSYLLPPARRATSTPPPRHADPRDSLPPYPPSTPLRSRPHPLVGSSFPSPLSTFPPPPRPFTSPPPSPCFYSCLPKLPLPPVPPSTLPHLPRCLFPWSTCTSDSLCPLLPPALPRPVDRTHPFLPYVPPPLPTFLTLRLSQPDCLCQPSQTSVGGSWERWRTLVLPALEPGCCRRLYFQDAVSAGWFWNGSLYCSLRLALALAFCCLALTLSKTLLGF